MPTALLSVHDVMPRTLPAVEDTLELIESLGLVRPTLLIVPGLGWTSEQLEQLRAWAAAGYPLAAHGWIHRARRIRGLRHRMHSALISRNAAEHLSLNRQQLLALMRRSYHWFPRVDLPRPTLYVPPAWALGDLSLQDLHRLPFEAVEVTQGIIDTRTGRTRVMPLVGFEADTAARAVALSAWNRSQLAVAQRMQQPLRVGIHPNDLTLRLGGSLTTLLQRLAEQPSNRMVDQQAAA